MTKRIILILISLFAVGFAFWHYVYLPEQAMPPANLPEAQALEGLPAAPEVSTSEPEVPEENRDLPKVPAPERKPEQESPPLDCISGEVILRTAKIFQEHEWTYDPDFAADSCGVELSFFRPNRTYKGVAYKWGGLDGTEDFMSRLVEGKKPGSYSHEGVISCATGIDCSGFIGYCWGITHKKYGTSTIDQISIPLDDSTFQIETDLRRGDALNLKGRHIVLFDTLAPNGNAIIYEATGGRIRKVRKTEREWTWFKDKGYKPIRFHKVCNQKT